MIRIAAVITRIVLTRDGIQATLDISASAIDPLRSLIDTECSVTLAPAQPDLFEEPPPAPAPQSERAPVDPAPERPARPRTKSSKVRP